MASRATPSRVRSPHPIVSTNQSDLEGAALWVITAFSENHTLSEMFLPLINLSQKLQTKVNKLIILGTKWSIWTKL